MPKRLRARAIFVWAILASVWVGIADAALAQRRGVGLDDLTPLRDFAALSSPVSASSDGSRLAVITRTADLASNAYRYEVHVVEAAPPFGQRVIAQAGDIVLYAARGRRSGFAVDRVALWSPDDERIAYLVGSDDGYAELWIARSSGHEVRRISSVGEHVVDFSWMPDGTLAYRAAISMDQRGTQLAEARRYGFRADDSFEPIYDVAPRIDDSSPVTAWRINVLTGERTRAELTSALNAPASVRITPADPQFADAESPELALEADWHRAPLRCEHDLCRGGLLEAWRIDNDTVAFQRTTGHHDTLAQLEIWSLSENRVRLVLSTEARLSGCNIVRADFFCIEDTPTQPPRLVRIDVQRGQTQTVWDPNPSWAALRMPRIERLDTTNPTGEQSFARLVYPLNYRAGRRYPLVIVQYRSRGFLRGGTGGEYPILPLSTDGYFVLNVDRPEHLARARTMTPNALLVETELDGSEANIKLVAIEHFISTLVERGLIDPERIGLTGMSDGTETLFQLLLSSERRFAAAVTSSAPPDPSTWPILSNEVRLRRIQNGAASPWNEADPRWMLYWQRVSPIYHLDRMQTPILFNLAETETLPAMPLIARLQEMNAPYDLYVYPGAYHNKWRPVQIRAAQTRALAWLRLWLLDRDTPDSRDETRVTRWRSMHEERTASR
ncbi:MAG: Atxe2 family lasso peptide isopeptidase [Hyphomonadaceae bacterium]